MDPQRRRIRLRDGRDLDVLVGGADSDRGFLMIDGTPSGVAAQASDLALVADLGLQYVTFARPGYADSTRLPGRTVADIAPDVRELAGLLGLTRLHVLGWSGGGPHALACAALLPDLVPRVATIASVAPFDAEGLDFLAGMGPENVEGFEIAVAGTAEHQASIERWAGEMANVTGADIADAFGGLVPPVDREALTGDFADHVAELTRDSVRTGIWGWYDDERAIISEWGYDLRSISVPVTIWQGSEDLMVPFAHGRWLADHVPGATPRLLEGEGHLSLAVTNFPRIVRELVG